MWSQRVATALQMKSHPHACRMLYMALELELRQGRRLAPARVAVRASGRDWITRLDVRYGIATHAVLITSPLKNSPVVSV